MHERGFFQPITDTNAIFVVTANKSCQDRQDSKPLPGAGADGKGSDLRQLVQAAENPQARAP